MKIYIYGKIVHVNKNYVILENNGIGEIIYVPNVERFKKDEFIKMFIYEYSSEYFKTTYGFSNFRELIVFEDLLSVQGIGPKTAINILAIGWKNIMSYISTANIEKLSEIPYLSTKTARQLVFEFQVKYEGFLQKWEKNTQNTEENTQINEFSFNKTDTPIVSENVKNLEKSLKVLGFKQKQIKFAIDKINPVEDLEKSVEEAIKIISQASHDAII
ncbi:Holliday junction branch migration protein RuvA [Mycoplasma miroungirhinis]|uniref:Holliday junction branch migration complex subunit RuvA n=1 Tax=Mycoplasma miroungirhinis TaxID=754516 RepID=A0A6M4JB55_9MOLU|nr:Holliday junction branch migration protein RuvA [Mycoplasma miroungirhinis]QJR44150.1 Holliday junction branch migration protein RuvA [Mycoplasma miroungirhinis]